MSLCHYGYQTYLSTQPISNMSLKKYSFMSLWLSNIFIHIVCIEYVIKKYVFMSFWLNAIYTLYVILFSILYLYMYEKNTRYQWFEEKSLSLHQNQLS